MRIALPGDLDLLTDTERDAYERIADARRDRTSDGLRGDNDWFRRWCERLHDQLLARADHRAGVIWRTRVRHDLAIRPTAAYLTDLTSPA